MHGKRIYSLSFFKGSSLISRQHSRILHGNTRLVQEEGECTRGDPLLALQSGTSFFLCRVCSFPQDERRRERKRERWRESAGDH